MGINSFVTYANRVLPPRIIAGSNYEMFALVITLSSILYPLSSILLTSYLFFSLSHYLVHLLPVDEKEKKLGARIINIIAVVFFMSSLFFIIAKSEGNWIAAMDITLDYHFPSGSFIYFIHGLVTLLYIKKAKGREEEVSLFLIKGETNSEIGQKLFISVNTVKSHIKSIYRKLEVSNRIQLIHLIQESTNEIKSN